MAFDQETDEMLMMLLKKGQHDAFSVLVMRHTDQFYRAAYKIVQNKEDAEDVVQACFLKIWDKPALWKEGKGAKFKTWFYRIITNYCLDVIRKKRNTISADYSDQFEDQNAFKETDLVETQVKQALERSIQRLPEKQMLAVTLCFNEGISNKEAAEIIGIKIKALESLLMRAKAKIKADLYKQGHLDQKTKKSERVKA